MIRSVGRLGPLKVTALVGRQLWVDLLVLLAVAALMVPVPDPIQSQAAVPILSVLGVGATIFIGFRNSTAYSRWWEARTLWGGVIINCRVLHNGLVSVDDGSADMTTVLDRLRRRQVRHAWQLAAELRGLRPTADVLALTPEDPGDASATDLLSRQARDIGVLVSNRRLDTESRTMLMAVNTALVSAQSGLERIRNQPLPAHYALFIRVFTWLFAVMAFNRLDAASHHVASLLLGLVVMVVFIVAERVGHLIEEPMSNTVFDLPMSRFCSTVTADLLSPGHPLARPREGPRATVWM